MCDSVDSDAACSAVWFYKLAKQNTFEIVHEVMLHYTPISLYEGLFDYRYAKSSSTRSEISPRTIVRIIKTTYMLGANVCDYHATFSVEMVVVVGGGGWWWVVVGGGGGWWWVVVGGGGWCLVVVGGGGWWWVVVGGGGWWWVVVGGGGGGGGGGGWWWVVVGGGGWWWVVAGGGGWWWVVVGGGGGGNLCILVPMS